MIANPATPSPAAVPHPFSLNDLRGHSSIAEGLARPSKQTGLGTSPRGCCHQACSDAFPMVGVNRPMAAVTEF
jgi:hypothetical protein